MLELKFGLECQGLQGTLFFSFLEGGWWGQDNQNWEGISDKDVQVEWLMVYLACVATFDASPVVNELCMTSQVVHFQSQQRSAGGQT